MYLDAIRVECPTRDYPVNHALVRIPAAQIAYVEYGEHVAIMKDAENQFVYDDVARVHLTSGRMLTINASYNDVVDAVGRLLAGGQPEEVG